MLTFCVCCVIVFMLLDFLPASEWYSLALYLCNVKNAITGGEIMELCIGLALVILSISISVFLIGLVRL